MKCAFIAVAVSVMTAATCHLSQAQEMGSPCYNLIQAAKAGDRQGIKSALLAGANINCTDENQNTPVILAMQGGYTDVVKLLIAHGADVNMRNVNGTSPLMIAAKNNSVPLVKLFLGSGADPTLQNGDGNNALVIAQNNQSADVAAYLQNLANKGYITVGTPQSDILPGMVNPAATLCQARGGNLKVKKLDNGSEYTICVFNGDRQCEVYAMYNNLCPIGGVHVTGLGSQAGVYCAITGGLYSVGADTCTAPSGNLCSSSDYFSGTCQ